MESKLKAPGMDRAGELADIRSAALEEAAQLCDSRSDEHKYGPRWDSVKGGEAGACASAIRALSPTPAKVQVTPAPELIGYWGGDLKLFWKLDELDPKHKMIADGFVQKVYIIDPDSTPVTPPAKVQGAAPGNPRDWLMDGSLLYRLNDDETMNVDEINITMAHGSRKQANREAAAVGLLNIICASECKPAYAPTKAAEGSIGDDQEFIALLEGFGDAYGAYQSGQNRYDESVACRAELVVYIDSILAARKARPEKLTEERIAELANANGIVADLCEIFPSYITNFARAIESAITSPVSPQSGAADSAGGV
jgi:hypothetical protein